jgi:hypothetical protein
MSRFSTDESGGEAGMSSPDRIQLHLVLPYKFDPRDEPRVARYLEQGYRVEQMQRVTDREAILTLARE